MKHKELNIEKLFEEYLVNKYNRKPDVSVADVARPERIDDILLKELAAGTKAEVQADLFHALQYAYNTKYGNWDKVNDLRSLYGGNWCNSLKPYLQNLPDHTRILSVGTNDGREIKQLFQNTTHCLDVLDISSDAITRATLNLQAYANARFFINTFENFESGSETYDLFISLRTFNSTGINLFDCLSKSLYVVKKGGLLIYSISNGYIREENGELIPVKGMFDYSTNAIDPEKPKVYARKLTGYLEAAGVEVLDCIDDVSEIFIIARK